MLISLQKWTEENVWKSEDASLILRDLVNKLEPFLMLQITKSLEIEIKNTVYNVFAHHYNARLLKKPLENIVLTVDFNSINLGTYR